jgi:hypothetical protein
MLQAAVRPRTREHLAAIHPMQYHLERAYHTQREQAAAQQRLVTFAERQDAETSTAASLTDAILSRLTLACIRGAHAPVVRRSQVA